MYYKDSSSYSRRSRVSAGSKIVLYSKLAKFGFFGLIGFLLLFFIYFLFISRDLPAPGKLSNPNIKDSTKILDKNGTVLYSIYRDYNRLYVPLKDIPKNLQEATIVAEDADFYKNSGFSIRGYLRVLKDLLLYRRLTGGSTITQQLVKNALLSPERALSRKIKEFILAVQVDRKYSKDQILEMYLNNIPYGGTAVGVEAASELYFHKHSKELDLAQSAFLAGLPQSPTYYSPFSGDGKSYIDRTKYVLRRLVEEGYISQKQSDSALKEVEGFKFSQNQGSIKAPHFVMYVKKQLEDMFGTNLVENGNLEVTTTLNYDYQKKAEEIVKSEIDKLSKYNVKNGAAMVLDAKTGGILVMVGSKDYFDLKSGGNFNAAVQGLRQPGSSLKPIVYATAFERGYTPSSLVMDVSTDFLTPGSPIYTPVNYDGKFHGPVQLRFALGNSLNIPAVKTLARVGIKPVMQKAFDMGITNWKPTDESLNNVGLSLVLGGREANLLQITSAYQVFANHGVKQEPFAIVEVKDSHGKVIYKHRDSEGAKVLSSGIAFLISHILLDNNARTLAFGPNSWLNIPGRTVAVKTGTTDQKRDNWTIGYTPSYVVGVWVGNNDNSKMNPIIASGVTGASPIWNKIMTAVLRGKPNEQFQKPSDVTAIEIDSLGGGLPVDGQGRRTEYFIKGTEPTTPALIYKKVKMSKHQSGKLANSDEISKGDYDTSDYVVFSENDPVSTDGKNRWQEAIQKWLDSTYPGDSKYRPPTETSDYKYGSDSDSKEKSDLTPTPATSAAILRFIL